MDIVGEGDCPVSLMDCETVFLLIVVSCHLSSAMARRWRIEAVQQKTSLDVQMSQRIGPRIQNSLIWEKKNYVHLKFLDGQVDGDHSELLFIFEFFLSATGPLSLIGVSGLWVCGQGLTKNISFHGILYNKRMCPCVCE